MFFIIINVDIFLITIFEKILNKNFLLIKFIIYLVSK